MGKKIRTFIAIKIIPDNNFIQLFRSLKEKLKNEGIKWTAENNFHITIRFLGETSSEQIDQILAVIESIASQFNPFYFNLKGLDSFKNKGKFSVLFAKAEKTETLKLLATALEKKIIKHGFNEESREFKPHLTFGRIKFLNEKERYLSIIQELNEIEIQKVMVSELIFYRSILNSSGPIYQPIKIFKLKTQ